MPVQNVERIWSVERVAQMQPSRTSNKRRNAEEEIPDFDFEGVRAATRATWNELLGRIQVGTENVDDDTIELFYSSLYRTHISPADCEGPFSERSRGDIDAFLLRLW